jgi:ABC-type transporter Mla subunit MlaD
VGGISVGDGTSRVQQAGLIEMHLEPEVDDSFATIGDTGMTPAQYIELSMGGDEDTAVFLNQGDGEDPGE